MKSYLSFVFILLCGYSFSQEVKVVFDVTSPDVKIHTAAVRHVQLMSQAYPDSEFEVVIYSGALPMLLKAESTVNNEINALLKNENVSFVVCGMTLERKKKKKSDLIEGVQVVPDGILEIVQKQKEGWGYIKEAN